MRDMLGTLNVRQNLMVHFLEEAKRAKSVWEGNFPAAIKKTNRPTDQWELLHLAAHLFKLVT